MSFKRNLHSLDRVIRAIIGIVCLYLGFIDTSIIGNFLASILVGIFGLINIFAAVMAYCPVYGVTGISTYSGEQRKSD